MIHISQIKTDGNEEGQAQSLDSGLVFRPEESKNVGRVKLDSDSGTLFFIRQNGDVVTVGGFPTLSAFGRGRDGSRGGRGAAGRNGRSGRDGTTGEAGCAGETGIRGIKGTKGRTGIDGDQGYQGDTGEDGERGDTGIKGEEGLKGVLGPRGNTGASCISGNTGAAGAAPLAQAVWSQSQPKKPEEQIWAFPTDSANPAPLPEEQDLLISMAPVYVTAERENSTDYFKADAVPVVKVRGGKAPYKYVWKIQEISEKDEPSITMTQTGKPSGLFVYYDRVPPDQDRDFWIRVNVVVTDAAGKSQSVTTKITYVAYNSGSRACFLYGQTVRTQSGLVKVEDLAMGTLISARTGMPKDTAGWTSKEIGGMDSFAAARRVKHGTERSYMKINDMGVTGDHPVYVKRDNLWRIIRARDCVDGDLIWTRSGEMRARVEAVAISVQTVDIAIDVFNAFYVGDILVHNPDKDSDEEKGRKWG